MFSYTNVVRVTSSNSKAITVTGREGPIGLWDVEAPTFSLDNRLTGGGKVVSLTSRPPFTS
jgi:hypothetical protein